MRARAEPRPPLWTRDYALTLLGTFSFFGSFFYLLAVLPDYVDTIGGSAWQVGLVVGAFNVVPLLIRPFVGRWSDRGQRLRVMRVALVVFAGAGALLVLSADVWSLLALRVVQGTGIGMYPTAAGSLVAEIAPRPRRGEGVGFLGMATSGAQMIFPALGVLVADQWGFDAVFVMAAVTAAATLLLVMPLHEPPPHRAAVLRTTPLIPRPAVFPMTIFLTVTFAFAAAATFLPLLGEERDLGNVGLYFLVAGAASVVVRPLGGRLSDRFGRVVVVLPGLVSAALGMWVLTQAGSPGLLLVAGMFSGAGLGATHTGLFALSVDRVVAEQRGAAVATFQLAWDVSGLLAGVVLGVVATVLGVEAVYWVASALLVGGIAALWGGRALGWTRPLPEPAAAGGAGPAGG